MLGVVESGTVVPISPRAVIRSDKRRRGKEKRHSRPLPSCFSHPCPLHEPTFELGPDRLAGDQTDRREGQAANVLTATIVTNREEIGGAPR